MAFLIPSGGWASPLNQPPELLNHPVFMSYVTDYLPAANNLALPERFFLGVRLLRPSVIWPEVAFDTPFEPMARAAVAGVQALYSSLYGKGTLLQPNGLVLRMATLFRWANIPALPISNLICQLPIYDENTPTAVSPAPALHLGAFLAYNDFVNFPWALPRPVVVSKPRVPVAAPPSRSRLLDGPLRHCCIPDYVGGIPYDTDNPTHQLVALALSRACPHAPSDLLQCEPDSSLGKIFLSSIVPWFPHHVCTQENVDASNCSGRLHWWDPSLNGDTTGWVEYWWGMVLWAGISLSLIHI